MYNRILIILFFYYPFYQIAVTGGIMFEFFFKCLQICNKLKDELSRMSPWVTVTEV